MALVESSSHNGSPFMRLPAELRLMVYRHLLCPAIGDQVHIKTLERSWKHPEQKDESSRRRTSYFALDRGLGRCSYKTTYGLDGSQEGGAAMHPAIMAVNRKIYQETTYHLYVSHDFHFGQYLDAVGPFISDLTPHTQSLVNSLSLRCLLHSPSCCSASDSRFWNSMSQRLLSLPKLRRLKITMQGGRPTSPEWDGPKNLSVSDIRLLYSTHHECMEWARELAAVESLEDVVIEADIRVMPRPETPTTFIYAALSASIETSLIQFLSDELGVPARVMVKESPKHTPEEVEGGPDAGNGAEGGGEGSTA
ncbi:hypothetical protein LIA77_11735 [Sarocladium implicatum]|nr:hypothetical protein LIA77_11735 [Sarocladium implicatum]